MNSGATKIGAGARVSQTKDLRKTAAKSKQVENQNRRKSKMEDLGDMALYQEAGIDPEQFFNTNAKVKRQLAEKTSEVIQLKD